MSDYWTYFNKELSEVRRMKKKLYDKTMTVDAFYTTWDRFIDIFDDLNMTVFVTNVSTSLFDILASIDFNFPSVNLNAIKILENFGFVSRYIPARYGYSTYGKSMITQGTSLTNYVVGIYDETQYDVSIFDPEDIWKAIGLLKKKFLTEVMNYVARIHASHSFSKSFNIFFGYTDDIFERVYLIIEAIFNYHICGFVVCGYSKLGEVTKIEESYYGTIWSPRGYYFKFNNILQLWFAPRCGISVCGFFRIVPKSKQLLEEMLKLIPFNIVLRELLEFAREQRDRFLMNITGIKLVSPYKWYQERKVESYGNKMYILTLIDRQVKNILRKMNVDPVKLQLYVSFVKELVFGRSKKHTYFGKGWLYVDINRFKEYLFTKYEKMGLDRNILEYLYNRFINVAQYWWNLSKLY